MKTKLHALPITTALILLANVGTTYGRPYCEQGQVSRICDPGQAKLDAAAHAAALKAAHEAAVKLKIQQCKNRANHFSHYPSRGLVYRGTGPAIPGPGIFQSEETYVVYCMS